MKGKWKFLEFDGQGVHIDSNRGEILRDPKKYWIVLETGKILHIYSKLDKPQAESYCCKKCDHKWRPRQGAQKGYQPERCPKCHTRNWKE